ncbi:unnamed protein product [Paramecium octaurelia]|uniref:Uncharacterized protein n=1 Tax=Paramecium octaurelia TaxID=43137 RepID=A0A8S1XMJ7_PAROT|nr:unnamed protein product [Paramecium octaurelia]
MNQQRIIDSVSSEDNCVGDDSSITDENEEGQENYSNDEHTKIQEEIKNLQQQQYNQAFNNVQGFVRHNNQKAFELIEYIQKNINLDQQQEIQEIILEYYRKILFQQLTQGVVEKHLIAQLEKKLREICFSYSILNNSSGSIII